MKWIKEDVEEAWIAWRNKDAGPSDEAIDRAMRRVMTRAVELAAARGGTMTEERVREYIKEGSDLGEHLATQGARIAALEAENDALKTEMARREEVFNRVNEACRDAENRADAMETLRDREHARADAHDKERNEAATCLESIRRRSLEAGNLERLISEHGLPVAMRWVVDGEEPAQSLVKTVTVSAGMAGGPLKVLFRTTTYPCSSTCTHDDAATPGHSERVKKKSEAFQGAVDDIKTPGVLGSERRGNVTMIKITPALLTTRERREYERGKEAGAEAMRAACLKDVREALSNVGAWDRETERIVTAAIEGATP